jgi:flagellum-specific peptidoglycan hydrolase FlgJ
MNKTPDSVIQAAVASYQKWSVPASVTLAQWALESNYGSQMPPGSNNPFGVKAKTGEPFVTAPTPEFINHKRVIVQGKFKKFTSLADAFDQHGKLLATTSVYARAMAVRGNPDAFADALTGIYATDPRYGTKLKAVMKANNYYHYDNQPPSRLKFYGKTAFA